MARSDELFDVDEEENAGDDDAPAQDAVSLLSADHAEVKQMFETYRQLVDENADDEQRGELARKICSMLTVHAEIEEEIFYPAMRENVDDELDARRSRGRACVGQGADRADRRRWTRATRCTTPR